MRRRAPGSTGVFALCAFYFVCSLGFSQTKILLPLLVSQAVAAGLLGTYEVGFRNWLSGLKPALRIGIAVVLFNAILGPGTTRLITVQTPCFGFGVTLEALTNGVAMMLRMLCAVGAFVLIRALGDEDELFFWLSRPFSRVSLAFSMGTRLLPYVERRMKAVSDVQKVGRDALQKQPVIKRVSEHTPLLRVAVTESLELSVNLAQAMFARGWDSGVRTAYPKERVSGYERAVAVLAVLALVSVFALSKNDAPFWAFALVVFAPMIPYVLEGCALCRL